MNGKPKTIDGNLMNGKLDSARIKATGAEQAPTSQAPEAHHKEAEVMKSGKAGKAGHHPAAAGHRMIEADHPHRHKKT